MGKVTLLNTRPVSQAQSLSRQLRQNGFDVISCPLMTIEYLTPELPKSSQVLFDLALFTSANAIIGWQKLLKQHPGLSFQKGIAIGQATAKKAQHLGLSVESLPVKQFDSEHLLAEPAMQYLDGKLVLLVKGQGGRQLLADTLKQRGAKLQSLEVYQRQACVFCDDVWPVFLAADSPVLLISSLESWQQLLQRLGDFYQTEQLFGQIMSDKLWHKLVAIIVFSDRIQQAISCPAIEGLIRVVPQQSNQGIIDSLRQIEKNIRQ